MSNETIQASLHSYIEDEREYARQEEKIKMVHNMLNRDYPLEQIARISRLDLNTIEQINLEK